ncbi:GAF and ANTAR domain-containing protein [Streptosporangium sp. CA-135522]|uniref:GAF and ANTAR domain-containing protein n=1 Tax=Streptosporangium sp. CA-135522 TaxID=3240072 RepID=UPI003D8DF169
MTSPFTTSDPAWPDGLLGLLLSTDTFETFLHELTALTVKALPEGSMCGITVARDSKAATIASSDDLTLAVDRIQYRTGEGPCLDTLSGGGIHYITDTSAEPRWRAFCTEAFAHGVRSCLSLPLPLMGSAGIVGGYNLYNTHPDAFDDDAQTRMRAFASNAAGTVALALRITDQSRVNTDLRNTLASRSVIDQAIGIIMAQQRCSAANAFALLSRASQNRNLKVRDLAAEIVTTVGGQEPDLDTFEPSA